MAGVITQEAIIVLTAMAKQKTVTDEERNWRENVKQAVVNEDVHKFHEAFNQLPNGKALLAKDQYFLNSLMRSAFEFEDDKMLETLLEYAIGKSLLYACSDGSLRRVKKILEKIEKLRAEDPRQTYLGPNDYTNKNRYKTPLMIALEMKTYDVVEYFIGKGYDKINLFTDEESKKTADEEAEDQIEQGNTGLCRSFFSCLRLLLMRDKLKESVKDDKLEEKRTHLRMESYRACSNPIYISYKFIYNNSDDTIINPLYYVLDLHQKLQNQARIDDEFKEDYEALSEQCEDFVEDLMNDCRSISEKKMLTNVLPDIKRAKMEKHLVVHSNRDDARDLTFLNLAIKANCDKLIAHPFNQLQLNSIVYPNMAIWKRRSAFRVFTFTLRHFLLLPFLAIFAVFAVCKDGIIIRYLENPMVKFLSHFWSILAFVVLLMASSFQDKFEDKLLELSITEWMILLWLVGFVAQAVKELSSQGLERYFAQWWNWVMIAMIVFFTVSYTLRFIAFGIKLKWNAFSPVTDLSPSAWHRLVLLANSFFSIAMVLSFVRLSMVFQMNDALGPLQLSLYHLILDVMKFMLFFSIFLVAFGFSLRKLYSHYIITQRYIAKTSPNATNAETDHAFSSVGSGLNGLFWSIFGYTEPQTFKTKDPNFTITEETGQFLFGLFVVLAVIVAVNMLIAMMTKSFEKITDSAAKKWKVSRTRIWMFWVEEGNFLPSPFNLLNLFRKIIVYFYKKITRKMSQACVPVRYQDPLVSNKINEEKDKIRVMLRRYIKNSRNKAGLPKATEEMQQDKQTEY